MQTTVGIVDDHQLFVRSLSLMLDALGGFVVTVEAVNGKDLQNKLDGTRVVPAIMLIDVSMPIMDGPSTASWLRDKYPQMHLAALSMNDTEKAILSMIKAGCCAYLLKDTYPKELKKALSEISQKGYYTDDAIDHNDRRLLSVGSEERNLGLLPDEITFLQLVCSDLTYEEIAVKMLKSQRTIAAYQEILFEKFNVQSLVSLCLKAIRKGVIKP